MTVDNDMGNRAEVVETTCDNDDYVDDDAAPAATTFADMIDEHDLPLCMPNAS